MVTPIGWAKSVAIGRGAQRRTVEVRFQIAKDEVRISADAGERTQAYSRSLRLLPTSRVELVRETSRLQLTPALIERIDLLGTHSIRVTETALIAMRNAPHNEALFLSGEFHSRLAHAISRGENINDLFNKLREDFGAEQLVMVDGVILTEADFVAPLKEWFTGS